ncbi:ABC transporter ATP-binding protein [Gammaproteobacteria bacterium]|nr:ABC transporter ATP-binding protein [Gammaproteobacteria bacterium]
MTQKTGQEEMTDLLTTKNLNVSFKSREEIIHAVKDLSFSLRGDEVLGIVGESGSGKSQTVLSIMGLLEANGAASGSAVFAKKELIGLPTNELNKVRGNEIAMIFQDPMSSLNPYISIGKQMSGVLKRHTKMTNKEIKERCIEMLHSVGISKPEERFDGYSFELSGGMRQRVMIASALLTNPKLLIADEPTTALDVTVQEKILDLILDVKERFKMSVIMITHDLGVVARTCDNVLVMKSGELQESGDTEAIFYSPKAEYTKKLLEKSKEINLDDQQKYTETQDANIKNSLVKATKARVSFLLPKKTLFASENVLTAVNDISMETLDGEVLGIVGESGSGKSTLAKTILGLQKLTSGQVEVFGERLAAINKKELKEIRKKMQVVFQDPFSSLNPRMTVFEILKEPLDSFFPSMTKESAQKDIEDGLMEVGLAPEYLGRYPHELSGGQCQRVAIARALMPKPQLLICDEAVSALDASIRGEIIELLLRIKSEKKLTMIFIAHDLAVVRKICDRVIVMQSGKVIEQGPTEKVFFEPEKEYTANLLSAVPVPDPKIEKQKYIKRTET